MRRVLWCALAAALLLTPWHFSPLHGNPVWNPQKADDDAPEKKLPDFDKLVKGAKELDGLFKLYQKDEHVYAEIKPSQLNKPLLAPIAVARGSGLGGFTLNFDEQWVLLFKKVSDTKLHLIRRNVRFKATPGSPVAKAVETTYTDSVLLTVPIKSIHPGRQTLLIDLGDIFMSDFAELGLGSFDRGRSTWHKVKAFPKNIELQVQATFSGGRWFFGDDSVIDSRGNTVVIHYGLVELPESGYTPRLADDRVGHFLSVVKDFSSDNKDTSFLRYVNRWRLERADTDAKNKNKLSVPKKKIVFWIENSVPFEYRAFVREGILEWNKAFEKIGFRDAIEVRQQENEEFDPEDMNYNTFRWITTGGGFAMGPSRANPLTGELLDADIIFDADMIRFWKQEAKLLSPSAQALADHPSPIMALKQGYGLVPPPWKAKNAGLSWDKRADEHDHGQAGVDPRVRLWAVQQGVCMCAARMKYELGLGAMALAVRGQTKGPDGVPEELIGQAIKMVVMHEVGHTLGLRHNFKASTMLKNEQINDKSITSKQGNAGSVMDYLPVNIAPKGVKQGDYFTTTIGPYDYLAIEYAYKPLDGGTEGEVAKLQEIASKGALPGHDYATDEDLFSSADPHTNLFDLGADPMRFAMDRMQLAEELMKTLADKVVEKGEGYQRVRMAFDLLLSQYGDAAFLTAQYVGGEHLHRDHRGDAKGRDPFVPVKADRQREALKFLQEHILSEKYFKFPPALLRKLAADRWLHWGNEGVMRSVDYPINQRILAIQRVVLMQLLDPAVLTRIQDTALKVDGEKPLTQAEVFRCLTDGVWGEYGTKGVDAKGLADATAIRRNLQRQHLKDLSNLVLGKTSGGFFLFFGPRTPVPPDARSLARFHLKEIQQRLDTALKDKALATEEMVTTRAHLEESRERVVRVLSASMQANE